MQERNATAVARRLRHNGCYLFGPQQWHYERNATVATRMPQCSRCNASATIELQQHGCRNAT
eukprot:8117927-Lingulodinium_polyedra.AAC.1